MSDGPVPSRNRFVRQPALTILGILAVLYLLVDGVVGYAVSAHASDVVQGGLRNEQRYRVSNAVYHHDLRPNVSFDSAF